MTFSADFSEVTALASDLGKGQARLGKAMAAAVRKATLDGTRDAKKFCPVQSGDLRASISPEFIGDGRSASMTGEFGPTAMYGAYVEEGTSKMGPQPYLAPAQDKNTPPFLRSIGDLSKEILG